MKEQILITSVEGNSQKLDGGSMFGNAPKTVWQRWVKPDEFNRINLACRSMLVEIKNTKILCEAGIGAFFEPKLAERYGVQNPTQHSLLDHLNQMNILESMRQRIVFR